MFWKGVTRVGGVPYGPEEVKFAEFSWGLGCMTNNQAKAHAFY